MHGPFTPEQARRLQNTAYVVSATSFEEHCLWRDFSHEAWNAENRRSGEGRRILAKPGFHCKDRVDWEQVNPGWLETVGTVGDSPVAVSIGFSYLDGHLILFWEATSQVVDYRMIEAWLEANVPAYAKGKRTNAMNFHNCLHALKQLPPSSGDNG